MRTRDDVNWNERNHNKTTYGAMFALPSYAENNFCNLTPHVLGRESSRALGVLTPVMCSYSIANLRMCGVRGPKHVRRMTEVEMKLMTLGAFIHTIRLEVIDR